MRPRQSLKNSYKLVGQRVWSSNDFDTDKLVGSKSLFTNDSLLERKPIPKKLEVFALVSGVEFSYEFKKNILEVQSIIKQILSNKLYYLVRPENLGVEYCVFKWPDGPWDKAWLNDIYSVLSKLNMPCFQFSIYGIQIHQDGCIVAKGYDERSSIFRIRQLFKDNLKFLPEKQSSWAHVPLGRILEPIGQDIFEQLRTYVRKKNNCLIASQKITDAKLVHETQWYMERKKNLMEINFV